VSFFLDGLSQAWDLITAHDPYLVHLVEVTLWLALVSTAIALVLGLPLGLLLGLARFRGRGGLLVVANAGLGLPPVVVGLVFALLMFPQAPLGRFHLLFTLEGVLVAQTTLALPIIVALSAASIREISPGLVAQARAFGAGRAQVSMLALREARVGIMAATIAAVGSGLFRGRRCRARRRQHPGIHADPRQRRPPAGRGRPLRRGPGDRDPAARPDPGRRRAAHPPADRRRCSPRGDVVMTDPMLSVDRLTVTRGRRTVVDAVSLEVARGEIVAVLGPNGAGKSSLLEAVGGVLPSSGAVATPGRIATVMQTPGLARRSVQKNVELALAWWGVPRGERRVRAATALERLRADHLAKRYAGALSGGERRRVHLARGVALEPDVLLLDEPFAGLDPETHAALAEDTASALRSSASSVVIVLHDRADAWAMADRVVVMLDGRVAADAPPGELLARPPSSAVARFLGYDGTLGDGDRVTLTRPPDLLFDPDGDLVGTVTRVVRLEDGARIDVATDRGTVSAVDHHATHAVGDAVRLRLVGGVTFPSASASTTGRG